MRPLPPDPDTTSRYSAPSLSLRGVAVLILLLIGEVIACLLT